MLAGTGLYSDGRGHPVQWHVSAPSSANVAGVVPTRPHSLRHVWIHQEEQSVQGSRVFPIIFEVILYIIQLNILQICLIKIEIRICRQV
jgi:hypothetical protein